MPPHQREDGSSLPTSQGHSLKLTQQTKLSKTKLLPTKNYQNLLNIELKGAEIIKNIPRPIET